MDSYYSVSIPEVEQKVEVIPLPDLKPNEPLEFTSSIFTSPTLSIESPEKLLSSPCVSFAIGQWYDGLPLILSVSRDRQIKQRVLSELGVSSENDLHDSIKDPLLKLQEAVLSRSCMTGITKTDGLGDKVKSYYRTSSDVGCLIKTTILASILNDSSASSLNERGEGYEEAALDKKTTMHIGIPIGGNTVSPLSVKTLPDKAGTIGKGEIRLEPLYLESTIGVLPLTKFQCIPDSRSNYSGSYGGRSYGGYSTRSNSSEVYQGLLSDRKSYLRALSHSSSSELLIQPHELIEKVVIPLCYDVNKNMHAKGRVHGDIKPANILLVSGGPKLIDARGCSIGSISSTFTTPWCPPEQTLGKPIDPTADVYALAMLVLKIVGAEIYGEIKNFKMPSTSGTIEVLSTEGVWLDSSCGLQEDIRLAWRKALAVFLSFQSCDRPKNGADLGDELKRLVKDFPLIGLKEFVLRRDYTVSTNMGKADFKTLKSSDQFKEKDEDLKDLIDKQFPVWFMADCYRSLS
eukprot:TRINITY_DN4289_c0_g1_i1.p1 TRINITY_DN4289_c0_g1~~TRINITY_DN4289_c0_g1_i1.p1  ORF type:complete len:516 (-),score=110.76 TRINITY_DN4289_c0_g1_i1:19-1566(-)